MAGVAKGPAGQHLLVRFSPRAGGEALVVQCPADLRFATNIPGGFKDLSCTLDWPAGKPVPEALEPLSEVRVMDRRTGSTVWFGYLTDPGQSRVSSGSGFTVTAVGPQMVTDEWREQYGVIDRAADSWGATADYPGAQQVVGAPTNGVAASSDPLAIVPTWALRDSISNGTGMNVAVTQWAYLGGLDVVRVWGTFRFDGYTTAQATQEVMVDVGSLIVPFSVTWNNGATSQFDLQRGVTSGWAGGVSAVGIYLRARSYAPITVTGDTLSQVFSVAVGLRRFWWDGTESPYTQDGDPFTYEIVYDLVGRGFSSKVEFNAFRNSYSPGEHVSHAAWWHGVSARAVLDFCVGISPAMWWAIFEPGDTGKPNMFIGTWNGPIRYAFSPGQADVELSGGTEGLANRCLVIYSQPLQGKSSYPTTTLASIAVPQLDDAGVTRRIMLDLTDDLTVSTAALAQARGVAALQAAVRARTSGKVTISEPVYDMVEGRTVMPWEVRAGSPVSVPDVPYVFSRFTSSLSAVAEDGIGVFLAGSVAFDAASGSAELRLDGGVRSIVDRVKVEVARTSEDTRTT